jgi:hypothetical protein
MYCRSAICAAWVARRSSRSSSTLQSAVKAAREDIARWRLTPSELEQMARALIEYTDRPWPDEAEGAKPVEWLYSGSGCTARTGTVRESHSGARSAREAVLSILVELPIERAEDEAVLLDLLIRSHWDIPH